MIKQIALSSLLMIFGLCVFNAWPAHAEFIGVGYPTTFSQPLNALPPGFTTIVLGDSTFYYAQGVFFQKTVLEQKYLQVPPPIGAVIFRMPPQAQMMLLNGRYYYLYNGVYYVRVLEGYRVIEPPPTLIL